MRAGLLRYRATIQQPTQTRGSSGESLDTFATVATRACSLKMETGSESFTDGVKREATGRYLVRMRYGSTIGAATPEWRIVVNGRTFHIVSVENVGNRNREMRFVCTEYADE